MIDGDNRGERCLARPQVSRQTLRFLVPVIAHEWLDCRPALTSAARSTSAVQRGCIQTKAWGNVTLRYEPTHARSRIVLVKVCLVKYGSANNRRRKSLSCRMAWSGLKLYWLPCARRRHLACIARPDASLVDRRFRQVSKDDRERRDETKHYVDGSKRLFHSFVISLI